MWRRRIIFTTLLTILALGIFAIALSYNVISYFNEHEVYRLTNFKRDVELSLIVTIANVIGNFVLILYLWKKGIIQKMFNIQD